MTQVAFRRSVAPAASPVPVPVPVLTELMSSYATRQPVASVAVVGNAPLPAAAARASAIDACDLVIRVNGFALDEPDTDPAFGRRADVVLLHWGIRATPWVFDRYSERLYLLNEPGRAWGNHEAVPPWWPPDLGLVPVPNREITFPLAAELGLPAAHWATTGTVAVFLAMHAFPGAAVRVAGFSCLDNPEQTTWDHAFGAPVEIDDFHDLRAEHDFMWRCVRDGRLEVLR